MPGSLGSGEPEGGARPCARERSRRGPMTWAAAGGQEKPAERPRRRPRLLPGKAARAEGRAPGAKGLPERVMKDAP